MVYYPDDHLKSEQNPVIQVTGCMTDDLKNGLLAIPMVAAPQKNAQWGSKTETISDFKWSRIRVVSHNLSGTGLELFA